MSNSGTVVDPRNRREPRLVVASLAASLGIHAAAFGLLPPVTIGFNDPPAPISVSLRAAPQAPAALTEEAAQPGDQRLPAPVAVRGPGARAERRGAAAQPKQSQAAVPMKRSAQADLASGAAAPVPAPPPPDRPRHVDMSNSPSLTAVAREPARIIASSVTTPPSFRADYLSNPPPAYPRRARRDGIEGTVRLKVRVSAAGAPAAVEIETSSGFDTLDRAAVNAVKAWKFAPARRGDDAIDAWVVVPVVFRLESG